jgi:ABC-type Zn uptake system ZnuABC Zn-binding protein ZnuA/Zn/Cd-binding protein ZinT
MKLVRSAGIAVLLLCLLLSGLSSATAQENRPLRVVATYSILGDIVQAIAGENIELTVLVGPDSDSHVYEPTPQDAIALAEADLIFENGLEFETWLDELYTASGSKATRIVVSTGIEPLALEEGDHDHEGEEHNHGEAPTTLDAWAGAFVSGSAFGLEAYQPAWDMILAATPELTMEDVSIYWKASSETAFDTLTVAGENVTFAGVAKDTTCAYSFVETHPIPQVEGETWSIFQTTDVACTGAYQYLLMNPIHAAEAGSIPHFHMSYGSGDLEALIEGNAAFFPSLYPGDTTIAGILPAYEANARAFGLYMAGVVGKEAALTEEEKAAMNAAPAANEHNHEHGEFDPHVWHDPNNGMVMAENIRAALVEADAKNAAAYDANAKTYSAELGALNEYIRQQVATIPEAKRILVTSHDTFGYLAGEYGFAVLNVLGSISTEAADPSAGEIAELIEKIKASGVTAIFTENITNPALVKQVAGEAGVTVAPTLYTDALGQAGTPGATYLGMLRYNIDTIVAALQ